MIVKCKFCGGEHEQAVGEPGTAFAGYPLLTCPEIPKGHIYVHDEPEGKPNGLLARLPAGEDPA